MLFTWQKSIAPISGLSNYASLYLGAAELRKVKIEGQKSLQIAATGDRTYLIKHSLEPIHANFFRPPNSISRSFAVS